MTVREIAKKAGCSTATVSRVINDLPGVGPEMRERVKKILHECNYSVNGTIRAAVEQKSCVLLFAYEDDINNYFYDELVRGAIDCAETGGHLLLFNSFRNNFTMDYFLSLIKSGKIDGVIVSSASSAVSTRFVNAVSALECPLVLIDSPVDNCNAPLISIDNEHAGYTATQYLIQKGHKKIGHISGVQKSHTGFYRWMGYVHAMRDAGLYSYAAMHSVSGGYTRKLAEKATYELLGSNDRPTAVFAANDMMAFGVYDAVRKMKLRIPEDVSVIGIDDNLGAQQIRPTLTTLKQPTYEIGYKGVEVALRLLNGAENVLEKSIILPTRIEERDSVLAIGH